MSATAVNVQRSLLLWSPAPSVTQAPLEVSVQSAVLPYQEPEKEVDVTSHIWPGE